jgi:hypothetical protein
MFSAMRRHGLVLVVAGLAGCGPAQPSPMAPRAIGNVSDPMAQSGLPAKGDYSCSIEEGGYAYPPFRCVVAYTGGRATLEKIEGSVRFRGVIAPSDAGFRFDGEVYCPWGDCTEPVSAEFAVNGTLYFARFNARRAGPAMNVTLEPAGSAYGNGYGGYDYGGYGYGGYGYGGYGGDLGYGGYGYGGYYP